MKRQHLTLLGMMLALLLLVGACGSDDDESGSAGTTAGETTGESVSGSISVIGVWTGPEQKSFQAVIDGFTEKNPDVTVKYTSGGDNIVTVLSTAVEGGNPPDIATVSQPGTMADFVQARCAEAAGLREGRDVTENFGDSIVTTGSVDGTLYGLLFKAANKSTVWYNVAAFEDAGVEAPDTWDDFLENAKTINAVRPPGLLDRRRGRLDAHRPLREHLPPHRGRRRPTTSSPSTRSRGPTSRSRTRWPRWRRSSATRTTSPAVRQEPCRRTSRPRSRTCSRRRRRPPR